MQRSRRNTMSTQRAYRYRKETRTLSLQHRLEYLQIQIQNLHRTFQVCNYQIEKSGNLAIFAAANSSNEGSSIIQMNEVASTMTQVRQQQTHSQESEDDFESTTSRPVNGGLHLASPISLSNSADYQENNPQGKTSVHSYSSLPTSTLPIVNPSETVPCAIDDGVQAPINSVHPRFYSPTDERNPGRWLRRSSGVMGYAFLLARRRWDSLSSKGSHREVYPSSECIAEPQFFQSDHDLLANLSLNGEWLDSHDMEVQILHFAVFPHVHSQ
ncbi:hypothetical protein BDV12DRAFT_190863 [Aspergillus spectabilis]